MELRLIVSPFFTAVMNSMPFPFFFPARKGLRALPETHSAGRAVSPFTAESVHANLIRTSVCSFSRRARDCAPYLA